jgi:hypothetical protein
VQFFGSFATWHGKLKRQLVRHFPNDKHSTRCVFTRQTVCQVGTYRLRSLGSEVNSDFTHESIHSGFVNLDPRNKDDKYWIEQFIFFKKKEYEKPLAVIKYIPPLEGKDPELWIRYFGHTKPSDIKAEKLLEYQKLLPDYRGKNKPKDKEILRRNKIVIDLYLAEKDKSRGSIYARERRVKGQSIAQVVIDKLKRKYPELNKTLVDQILKVQTEK